MIDVCRGEDLCADPFDVFGVPGLECGVTDTRQRSFGLHHVVSNRLNGELSVVSGCNIGLGTCVRHRFLAGLLPCVSVYRNGGSRQAKGIFSNPELRSGGGLVTQRGMSVVTVEKRRKGQDADCINVVSVWRTWSGAIFFVSPV